MIKYAPFYLPFGRIDDVLKSDYNWKLEVSGMGIITFFGKKDKTTLKVPTGLFVQKVLDLKENLSLENQKCLVARYPKVSDSGEFDGPDYLRFFFAIEEGTFRIIVSRKELEDLIA